MDGSIPLFQVRGIAIRMHVTFPLILIWAALQFGFVQNAGISGAMFGIIVTLLLFAIVVLHELGHSFAALYYGVPVEQIVLMPLGGVAQLGRIPEEPKQEFVIAIAGPAVNFALAVVLGLVGVVLNLAMGLGDLGSLLDVGQLSFGAIFNYVFVSNLFLGVFNLLPAFPMDGGRILRAFLASRMNYVQATRIAVSVGQGMAWLLGLWGFLGGGFFLILIAIFVYMGAGQEGAAVEMRHLLGNLTVGRAYSRQVQTLSPTDTLRQAINLTLSSFQADFPVVQDGRFLGLLTQSRLLDALHNRGPDIPVSQVMITDIKPVSPDDPLVDVQHQMAQAHLNALPVVENGRFVGLITARDINEIIRLMSVQPELVL